MAEADEQPAIDFSRYAKQPPIDFSKYSKPPVTGSASPASASVSVPPAEPPAAGGAAPPVKRTPTPPIGGDYGTVQWETPEQNAARMAASKQASQPPGIGESITQGAKEGFGDEPATLGFDYRNPLKSFQDVIDLAGRATNAGFGAAAGAVGDTAQKLGMSQGMAQRGKRDVMQGGQVAAAAGMLPEFGLGAKVMPKAPEPPAPKPPVKTTIETGDPKLMNEFNMMLKKPPAMGKPANAPGPTPVPTTPKPLGAAATPQGQVPPTPHWQSMDYISDAVRGNPKLEAQLQAQKDANAGPIGKAASFLRNMWAPQTVSESAGRAEGAIRETRGIAERDTAQANAGFEQFRKSVNQLPEPDRWALVDYMETRSKGTKLSPALKQFQPIADSIREQMEKVRGKLEDLEKLQGTKYRPPMDFIDDYIHHAWQDPAKARLAFQQGASPKTGSGGFTKKRQIPTMAEGIKKGLVPATSDPIEMSMNYIDNANKYIASAKAFEIGRRSGDIKWYSQGKAPPGWQKLDKVRANQLGQEAYAPEGYAQIFNNFHSGGFFDWKVKNAGDVFKAARQASNGITQFKLGLSGFHAFTEGTEAFISGIAKGMGEAARGHPLMAAKSIAKAPLKPFEPMLPTRFSPGRKLQQQYLGIADHGVNFAKIADLAARSHFRTVSYDKQLKAGYGSIIKSIKRGAMRMEMADAAKKIKGPMSAATQLWRGAARVMDTIAAPIFEHYVPQLKNAAFYGKMDSWLKMNPTASEAEQLAAAREIGNSIDNRFGEMNQDNIFWNQTLKQSLQVGMTSYSWTTGTIKEIGGGVADLARGKLTPKAEYVLALPMGVSILNSVYQYLMTGEPPKDYKDVISPRTGGTIPKTQYRPEMPERAILPGYIKDVFGWAIDPKQEAANKIAPGIQMANELIFRKDWRGDPIDDPELGVPGWLKASGMSVMNAFTPISTEQMAGKNIKQGTAIPGWQRGAGIRPAPMYQQDPKGYEGMKRSIDESAWEKKMFHDATAAKNNGDIQQYNAIMQDIRRRRLIQKNQQTQNKGIQ